MRHIAGRGIRRPDHRPDAPGGHREIRGGGPGPGPPLRPTFDQAPGALRRAPGRIAGELPELARIGQNGPKPALIRGFDEFRIRLLLDLGVLLLDFGALLLEFVALNPDLIGPKSN